MIELLVDTLSDVQRIALAYSPRRSRPWALALLAFDNRLAQAIRAASEPIMAQMRLAWWRDQLRLPPTRREGSDTLVVALESLSGEESALLAMVDGWEELLAEQFDQAAIGRIAAGRGEGFAALARKAGHPELENAVARSGQAYVLADLAANLADGEERSAVLSFAEAGRYAAQRLPRTLRSVAVLDGLARRSLSRGGAPLLDGPGSALTAIRLGLTGR